MHNRTTRTAAFILMLTMLWTGLLPALAEPAAEGDANIRVENGVASVYDTDAQEFVENAELTANPVLDGDLKPEDPPQVPGYWQYDPALAVIAGDMETGGEDSSFTVNGSVTLETNEAGPSIAVYSDAFEKEANVTVNGDVTTTATLEVAPPEYAKAIAYGVTARSAGGTVNITVDGTVTAVGIAKETVQTPVGNQADAGSAFRTDYETAPTTSGRWDELNGKNDSGNPIAGEGRAFAVYADAVGSSGVTTVHVTGDAVARTEGNEDTEWEETYTMAVEATTELGGTAKVTVDGKAVAESTEHHFPAKAVDVLANTGSTAEITVGKGAEGQIAAQAKNDGTAKVSILEGGVTAVIQDPAEDVSLAAVNLRNGGEEGEEEGEKTTGTLEISISGDVTASGASENIGIQIRSDEGGKTDVVVDGTVNASDEAVLLLTPETQIGENVTLTVWELKPNQDGAVVSRLNEEQKPEEDKQGEKAVQYIIRVKADQHDIISTQGTEEYKGFNVAHEGDTVTLRLNIPEGYEITGAYGDVNQSVTLTKDANGNYFLTVPRGGAVELSVKLEKTGEDNVPVWYNTSGGNKVRTLLTITDKTGKAVISFFSRGLYTVKYEDGTSENGSYTVTEDTVVLINSKDTGRTRMVMSLNSETGLYELAFHPSADPGKTYEFEASKEDVDTMIAVRLGT